MKPVTAAIYASPLNLAPQTTANTLALRVPVPRADWDKRQQLVRDAQSLCEKARIAIRQVRIDGQKEIKRDVDGKVIGKEEARGEGKKVRSLWCALEDASWLTGRLCSSTTQPRRRRPRWTRSSRTPRRCTSSHSLTDHIRTFLSVDFEYLQVDGRVGVSRERCERVYSNRIAFLTYRSTAISERSDSLHVVVPHAGQKQRCDLRAASKAWAGAEAACRSSEPSLQSFL